MVAPCVVVMYITQKCQWPTRLSIYKSFQPHRRLHINERPCLSTDPDHRFAQSHILGAKTKLLAFSYSNKTISFNMGLKVGHGCWATKFADFFSYQILPKFISISLEKYGHQLKQFFHPLNFSVYLWAFDSPNIFECSSDFDLIWYSPWVCIRGLCLYCSLYQLFSSFCGSQHHSKYIHRRWLLDLWWKKS